MKKEVRKIPALRFADFHDEWVTKESKELFGNSRSKGNLSLPIFSVTQNRGLVPRNSLDRKMGDDASPDTNLYVGPKYLTYNMMRMWQGAIGIAEQECMVSPAYIVLKPTKDTCSEFFINFFQRSRCLYLFWAYSYGLTNDRLRLYYKDFARIPFSVPTPPEQQKIASFLATIDKNIEQLTRKKRLLEQYKKGVMQKIFSQEIRFKDDNGQDYPDWEEKRLDKLGSFHSGTGFTETEQGGREGLPFLKVSDMNLSSNEFYINIANHYVNDSQIKHNKYKPIKKASIIFAKVGAAIFLERKRIIVTPFLIDNNMMAFVPQCNILFMKYALEQIRFSRYAQVGALPSYNAKDLGSLKLTLPLEKEQQKIAGFLASIDAKITTIQTQLTQTKNFKKGLLQKMFV